MADQPTAARGLAAATAVARASSVACDDAVVLAAGSNTLVHLRPAPVVARVMTATAVLHADVQRWLTREIAVGGFLGDRGLAVSPSDLLAPGPHERDGMWMTFWRFVEHDPSQPPDAHEIGSSLRELHDALAGFAGELGPLREIRDWLDELLGELRPSPKLTAGDRDLLRSRLRELAPAVFEGSLPVQAIHGDASMSNLLRTNGGLLWNDLEDVCVGPVHWDLAGLVLQARVHGRGEDFVMRFLDAYGGLEVEALSDFIAAHRLYAAVWEAFTAQRDAGRSPRLI
jgi:hypothetical protein